MWFAVVIFAFACCHLTIGFEIDNLPPTCERITHPLCRRTLPYNATRFPNLLSHRSQNYAVKIIQEYSELMPYANCSKHAVFFLCSYFFPICLPGIDGPVKPCRSMCHDVRRECGAIFRFWPSFVKCEELPEFTHRLCIQPESFVKTKGSPNSTCLNRPPVDYNLYINRQYDYVIKLKVISIETFEHHETVLHGRAARIFKHGNVTIHKGRIKILANINSTCPALETGQVFLVCGHENASGRKLLLSARSLVEAWDEGTLRKIRIWQKMERRSNRKGERILSNM